MPLVNTYTGGPEGPPSVDGAVPGEQNQPSQRAKRQSGFCGQTGQPSAGVGPAGAANLTGSQLATASPSNMQSGFGAGRPRIMDGQNVARTEVGHRSSIPGPGPLGPGWTPLPRGYRSPGRYIMS